MGFREKTDPPAPRPVDTCNAQQHVWLSQMGTYYWHVEGRGVKNAVKLENHLPCAPQNYLDQNVNTSQEPLR